MDSPRIGTLNEGSLHQQLKARYGAPGAAYEVPVDGFVADIVRDGRIVEIQTRGLGALARKLPRLLAEHRVTLVHPIVRRRVIVKQEGARESRRRSPWRGSLYDVFAELVSIPTLLDEHPNLELDLVLIDEEELRVFDGRRGRSRRGWVVTGRRLVEVVETRTIQRMADLFADVTGRLGARFTTQDLADAMERPRFRGQQAAYCFRAAGVLEVCGKDGNARIYRRARRRRGPGSR